MLFCIHKAFVYIYLFCIHKAVFNIKNIKMLFLVFTSQSGVTNQSEDFFWYSNTFELQIQIMDTSAALEQNQFVIEVKKLAHFWSRNKIQ